MIRIEARSGGVRLLRLDRPDKRNALDRAMIEALLAALHDAAGDPAIAAIVLAGAGGSFCAGADLAEMKRLAADPLARQARSALTVALLEAPARLPKPIVAAVAGAAMGAGASLALACDAVAMAEDARLAWPEASHAMLPRLVAPVLLRHLGPKHAFDLLATGRAVGAAEALALGLASRIVPKARMDDDVPKARMDDDVPKARMDDDVPKARMDDDVPKARIEHDVPIARIENDAPAARVEDEACAMAAAAALLPPDAMAELKRMVHA